LPESLFSPIVSRFMTSSRNKLLRLFATTFVSAFLFIFGASTLAAMFAPVAIDIFTADFLYHPALPVAPDRTEAFLDLDSIPAKQLFPPLSSPTDISEGNWIRLPGINANVPLALSPSLNDDDVISTLDQGAALYPNGIAPGRLGNVFIAAHSTGEPWKGKYRFAFLKINEITEGNVIHLDYNGARYTYTVVKQDIITPTSDYRVISDRPVPTVTLMACWPLWSTSKRMLITAELTNITQLTTHAS